MLDLTYSIRIAAEIPLPFSYFIKRVAIRLFFNLPKFLIIALFLTAIIAIIYFLIAPGHIVQPKLKASLQRRPYLRPTRAAGTALNREAYKQRQEEKRRKRKELLEKAVKK